VFRTEASHNESDVGKLPASVAGRRVSRTALKLDGSNATAHLFPEAAPPRPASHEKDTPEHQRHEASAAWFSRDDNEVCQRGVSEGFSLPDIHRVTPSLKR
jgi:hypothetical protein